MQWILKIEYEIDLNQIMIQCIQKFKNKLNLTFDKISNSFDKTPFSWDFVSQLALKP